MAFILNIETATSVCSVALSKDGVTISEEKNTIGQNHAKLLTVLVKKVFNETNLSISDLDAVAISQGPGSYTGLRIGTSVAKGICYAKDIPLIAVNTLQILANQAELSSTMLRCPMIDARRMEVYCQLFDAQLQPISEIEAKILNENSFQEILTEKNIAFFGDGAAKFHEICSEPKAQFIANKVPLASQMALLSERAFLQQQFVDVAYFTPAYLKKFQVTTSKKRIF